MHFSAKGCCLLMDETEPRGKTGLRSNQEKANKNVAIRCIDALRVSQGNVILHSRSGDTNIFVLAASLI